MFIQAILWMIFIGSAILLAVIILLQEAKGGGLAEAFGGMGAQTFGVKASGINRFTAYVAVAFLLSAVLIGIVRKGCETSFTPAVQESPSEGRETSSPLPADMGAAPEEDAQPTGAGDGSSSDK